MGMNDMISRFSDQLREAIEIGRNARITTVSDDIHLAYVAGMGGSGIGANFVAEIVRDSCPIPYLVGKGYDLPTFVNKHTLGIASSYSGNTEETLISLQKMESAGARIICIASGGKIIEHAEDQGYDYIRLPEGWDSPRACLGFSTVQQLYILNKMGFISDEFEGHLLRAANLIDEHTDSIRELASDIADKIYDKTPVIYSVDRLEPAAIRLRQQINENAKMLCWHHVIPEMNHNELVGWKDQRDDLAVVMLRSENDYSRDRLRTDITKEIISGLCSTVIEIDAIGNSKIEQIFYLVHVSDWISWYLAEKRNMDAVEIDVIDYLKKELGKKPIEN